MKRPKYINRPFNNLPLKQRAILILYISGFTYADMKKMLRVGRTTISSTIKANSGLNLPISEGRNER